MDDFHLEKMRIGIEQVSPDSQQLARRPCSLHRTHSWPPALSVNFLDPSLPLTVPENVPTMLGRQELVRNGSSSRQSQTLLDTLSLCSSCETPHASEASIEQKKEGFRAVVSKRWLQTKQILQEKAKLYREQHRARHREKMIEPEGEKVSGSTNEDTARQFMSPKSSERKEPKKEGTLNADAAQKAKLDELKKQPERQHQGSSRKDHEVKDADIKQAPKIGSDMENPPRKEASRRDSTRSKAEKTRRKEKVINTPHELSFTLSQFSIDGDRGRSRKSTPIGFASAFSSYGELLYNANGYGRKRTSRTLSGRRHSWRAPDRGIVPVHEETESVINSLVMEDYVDKAASVQSETSVGR